MIEEAFVDFYTAEKLKEKGWNQNTMASYVSSDSALLIWYNPDSSFASKGLAGQSSEAD